MLEARDEAAIAQLRPALRSASQLDDRRLFADVADAGLSGLGVDAQVRAVARLLATEADLDRLQMALPGAQYAALHALAGGMTVDEARAEVARLFPVAQRPGRSARVTWPPRWSAAPTRSPSRLSSRTCRSS